jgi:hypothetical protein
MLGQAGADTLRKGLRLGGANVDSSNVCARRLPHQGPAVWMTATKEWTDATKV